MEKGEVKNNKLKFVKTISYLVHCYYEELLVKNDQKSLEKLEKYAFYYNSRLAQKYILQYFTDRESPKYDLHEAKRYRAIFEEVNKMDGASVMATLNAGEMVKLTVEGTDVEFGMEDVLVETLQKDGFVSDSDGIYTVVLDTNLTEELIEEGFVREILSKIQTMRKDSDFEVQDNIKVLYYGSEKIDAVIKANKEEISSQALAVSIENAGNDGKEWNINGEKVKISIAKA
jgi:hypothetical protein